MLKIEELENSSSIVVDEGVENFGRGRFFWIFVVVILAVSSSGKVSAPPGPL
jgi:hypothetical protein